MGRAQQMLMEAWADGLKKGERWPAARRRRGALFRRHSAAALPGRRDR